MGHIGHQQPEVVLRSLVTSCQWLGRSLHYCLDSNIQLPVSWKGLPALVMVDSCPWQLVADSPGNSAPSAREGGHWALSHQAITRIYNRTDGKQRDNLYMGLCLQLLRIWTIEILISKCYEKSYKWYNVHATLLNSNLKYFIRKVVHTSIKY